MRERCANSQVDEPDGDGYEEDDKPGIIPINFIALVIHQKVSVYLLCSILMGLLFW